MTAEERPMPADGAETGGYIVVPPDFVETVLRFLDHRVFATPRVPLPGPTIPQSYEEYLRVVRAQEERDRGRFIGTSPAIAAEPVYDARSGAQVDVAPREPSPAWKALMQDPDEVWTASYWHRGDREQAGDLFEAHRHHPHAVDMTGPTHWSQTEARMSCRVCRRVDVFEDGMLVTVCHEHGPTPRTRVFVDDEKPPPCLAEKLITAGPCVVCQRPGERHHVDGNTLNNTAANVVLLCRKHHRTIHPGNGPRPLRPLAELFAEVEVMP